ncbi:EF-hand domain-containing protein [Chelativorans sp. M5D2P16]|uniref:EF-hand domain-containing protein n=1 Tax=Chelativorans sp. M5D2P16 TaxID=3095678 RepID=UPI002ACA1B0C|nr:EF-hand domain-containing protein [Chelativorans sp. M5D2P16]MDZ5697503.1 EF-hand domain-containing protein [Chelativorans sp. M5D2P16]
MRPYSPLSSPRRLSPRATDLEPPAGFDEAAWQAEWDAADTDGDGRISREEAMANPNMTDAAFDEIDLDGDGYISPEEDKAALFSDMRARENAAADD